MQKMTRLSLSLLGPFQVTLDGKPITDFTTDKARALLAYLTVEADRPHRREVLAGLLWPDESERKARQNLRQALSHLRQAISDEDEATPFLLISRQTIQFNLDSDHWLDVAAFTALTETCEQHRHRRLENCLPCLRRLERMIELHRGDFLEQFFLSDSSAFEEWALLKREWLRRQTVEALSHLAGYYERRGDYGRARHFAWRQVTLEPWREEAHRQLMRLLALDGQRSAALIQYETCRRVLAEELSIEPTVETTALYEQIRDVEAQRHEEEGSFPSLQLGLSTSPPSRLPLPPSPFVGRRRELAELAERLADPDCRLVTITGPGGIGKTRLALQVAAEQNGAFAHGVYFVPLASISSGDLIIPTVANALGFSFYSSTDIQTQLLNYLRGKELMLVLDNLEHILERSDLLTPILYHAPDVVLLITSRARLNLREEWVYQVEGLTYPADDTISPTREELEDYSAVQLFLQSARQGQRQFALSEIDASHVARICQMMEGMPLGVELAAAWVQGLSCQAIAEEIERSIDSLTTRLRNVPERHRSLRAVCDHSWNLLSEHERTVFCKLSIFRGGFLAAAASAVAGASPSILLALLDKSFLRRTPAGRYQIHEVLRQYAAEKLAQYPKEQREITTQHSAYYANWIHQQMEALKGPIQRETLKSIGNEVDNVRLAWQWALTQIKDGTDETAALHILRQSAESLYLFYTTRDWYHEGEEAFGRAASVLEDSLARDYSADKELLLGKLWAYQGKCCEFTAHSDQAQGLFEKSLNTFRRLDARIESALPLQGLGYMAHIKGEYARAESYFKESIAISRESGDTWSIATILNRLCLVARRRGEFSTARQYAQESLALRREMGDQRGIISCLNNLGLVYCDLGEYAQAKRVLEEALQICQYLDYQIGIGNAATGLCQATFRLGESETAERYGEQSLDIYRDIGDYWGVAIAYNNLGRMAAELKDYAKAKRLYQQGITIYRQIGIKSGLSNTLGNLGEACYRLGEHTEALQYLHEALQIAHEIGATPAMLKNIVELAPLLAQEGQITLSLELLAFCIYQSAIAEDVRERAAIQFAELAADLDIKEIATAHVQSQRHELDAIVTKILSATPEK
jgi:predicted ATPase/DNA-binding SARP family transcriptional activator/Tfp pilus assembly protein PilF